MRNRYGLLFVFLFAAGLSGCAATSKNPAGTPMLGSRTWNQAPAPAQRTVATTNPAAPADSEPAESLAKPTGLTRYFPGFSRSTSESPRLSQYRPTWFGLRPNVASATKAAVPTTYMTDARSGLNRPMFDAAPTLPVALDVPAPRPVTDQAVTPTNVEQTISSPVANPSDSASPGIAAKPTVAVVSSKATKPGESEANPLPPAIDPTQPQTPPAPDQMPQIPSVDPQTPPKPTDTEAASPTTDRSQTSNASDEKAFKAIPSPNPGNNIPADLPEPTVPASYASVLVAKEAVGMKKLGDCKIFASPQTAPKVAARPTPQALAPRVKPTSQSSPVPTSLSKPSPQATATAQGTTTAAETTWQRPCLRRMIRKVCKLGEYADPPTAAPH